MDDKNNNMGSKSTVYYINLVPFNDILADGFNPSETYESNWIISPGRDENKKKWNHHLVYHDIALLNEGRLK